MSNSLQSNGLANPMDTSGSSVLHYFLEFAQIHVRCKKEEKTITNDRVGITDSMYMNLSKLWDMMKDRDTWQAVVLEVTKSGTQLNDSTTTKISIESGFYMIISSSASLLSFCHQSFPASGSFLMIQLVESGGQSTGATPLASVFPTNIQCWFPLGLRTIGELSIQLSSVVSNSLWPHESQNARPSCPSQTPGVYSNTCPSSPWCDLAISSPVIPSPPATSPSQHQGLFQWVNSSHEVAKVLEFQLQHQSFHEDPGLISFRMDWLDLLAVQGTLKSLLQHHSPKAPIFWCSTFFTGNSQIHTWPLEKP